MLRSFWQRAVDFVYNSVASVFRTQAEINTEVSAFLGDKGTVTNDPGAIPSDARRRKNGIFVSPDDTAAWIDRTGIPSAYITILEIEDYEDDNIWYHIYVIDGGDL